MKGGHCHCTYILFERHPNRTKILQYHKVAGFQYHCPIKKLATSPLIVASHILYCNKDLQSTKFSRRNYEKEKHAGKDI